MSRRNWIRIFLVGVLLGGLWAPGAVIAQGDFPEGREPSPARDGSGRAAIREAMRTYFQNRMRQALGLTDEQMADLSPRLERITEAEAETRQERAGTLRRLREGLQGGASDAELQRLLDRWENLERDQRESERRTLAEIDGSLTVRQRVQLRFFIQRFRTEMRERIRELGSGERPGRRRDSRAPGRRRP